MRSDRARGKPSSYFPSDSMIPYTTTPAMRRVWPPRSSNRHKMMHVVGAYVARLPKRHNHEVNKMVFFLVVKSHCQLCHWCEEKTHEGTDIARSRRTVGRSPAFWLTSVPSSKDLSPSPTPMLPASDWSPAELHGMGRGPALSIDASECVWAEIFSAERPRGPARTLPKESCGRHRDAPGRAQQAPVAPE